MAFDIDYKGKSERNWLDEAKTKNPCGNGIVLKTWNCGDSLEFVAECSINPDEFLIKGERKWIIAVMYP